MPVSQQKITDVPNIVHSQFQRPGHLPKYVELGLVPAYFTLHTYFWGDVHVKNIGKEAAYFICPMKAAKESRPGVIIGPEQRVDAYTALQALTTGPAYQIFEENRKGKIKVGLLADFVIIEKNPLKQAVADIKNNTVIETIKQGKTVYKRDKEVVKPGSDRDAHGCIGSAGYSWCAKTNQCERPWELARKYNFENTQEAFDKFCNNQ